MGQLVEPSDRMHGQYARLGWRCQRGLGCYFPRSGRRHRVRFRFLDAAMRAITVAARAASMMGALRMKARVMNPAKKALWFIESHLADRLTLDEIADVAGISRFHMVRAFAAATGLSVMRYVRARRLSEAAREGGRRAHFERYDEKFDPLTGNGGLEPRGAALRGPMPLIAWQAYRLCHNMAQRNRCARGIEPEIRRRRRKVGGISCPTFVFSPLVSNFRKARW